MRKSTLEAFEDLSRRYNAAHDISIGKGPINLDKEYYRGFSWGIHIAATEIISALERDGLLKKSTLGQLFALFPEASDKPLAFKERESCDPYTGEYGILRDEWRITPISAYSPESLISAFGLSWLRHFIEHEFCEPVTVLERRYIRRGKIEPWKPVSAHSSDESALREIDPEAIVLDCPLLLWIQHERKQSETAAAEERERARVSVIELEKEREQKRLSHKVWCRLYNSDRDRPLCDEWNELTKRPSARALAADLKLDREFMRLHTLATTAITVPTKRSAMRRCLDYYEFMWRHREVTVSLEEKEI